jgi:hypothetical protein
VFHKSLDDREKFEGAVRVTSWVAASGGVRRGGSLSRLMCVARVFRFDRRAERFVQNGEEESATDKADCAAGNWYYTYW